ncbi:Transcription initiation factor TFIID subunit 2 [Orchesella cincta]|uniref:Transcription initiation factor TFIID subunit 2 n=1 Tax=Orchesella cincta TaxID=48709 RepID=A0A1D2N1X8_ORCCI|nr:Transcription initiation factor TFIID subunit 2 [Orchesella cincta]
MGTMHQLVHLDGISLQRKTIIGLVELTLQARKSKLKTVKVNCKQCKIYKVTINNTEASFSYYDPAMEITDAEHPNNQYSLDQFAVHHRNAVLECDPDAGGGEIVIRIPPELSHIVDEGRRFTVAMEYSLENPQSGMHFFVPEDQTGLERAHMFTTRHENSSRLWFPCIDSYSEVCTWDLEFKVEENLVAVSCGDLVETVQETGRLKTYHYYVSTPTAAPNIGLAVGPFEIYVDPNMHEVVHFCLPGLMNLLRWTSRFTHEIFEYYEDLLATRFPYSSFKSIYVHEAAEEMTSYSSMCILDTNLLHTSAIIDQTYETRRFTALSLAEQFYSCYISMQHTSDAWLSKGISNYLCGLYLKKFFGNNEYRHWIHSELQEVLKFEQQYGGVILDPSLLDKSATAGSTGIGNLCSNSNNSLQQVPRPSHTPSEGGDGDFYFSLVNPQTVSPLYLRILAKKAHLTIRMLEHRIGNQLLLQVLNKQLSLASIYITPGANPTSPMLISTASFTRAIFTVTGKDMTVFMDQWVRQGGHVKFHMSFIFNRKRNTVELELKQECLQQLGIRKYVGPLTVALQELDGTFKHVLQIEGTHAKADIVCHSKSRRQKKKKIPLCTGEEVDMDLSAMDADSPVLWIRLDPDMTLIRAVDTRQPDFQWQYQLRHERDVTAQVEAIWALEAYPNQQSRMALTDLIENEQAFYKVRCEACYLLFYLENASIPDEFATAKTLILTNFYVTMFICCIANLMVSTWSGPPAMLPIFRKLFGSFSCPQIVKQNDFSNLQHYFLLKTIPVAMASLRNVHGICPVEVHKFLIDLFKYNDNSRNRFSDNYYRAALVASLGNTVTPVVSLLQPGSDITAESLSSDTRTIMEEISRCLNLEKMLQCYKYTVTVECLKALRKLQKFGHLPNHVELFKDYACYGQFHDVRLSALEAFVDYTKTDGKLDDVEYLLDIIENDPNPKMRHDLSRLIVHCLSEKTADRRSKTKLPFHNKAIALRLWKKMNYDLNIDARLRCDLVDLYFTLFGTRKPVCLLDESQQHLADEITSRRKSPLTIREDVDYKPDIVEEIVEIEQPKITPARVLSSKRESMASDNSAELPDALDSSLPTSFEPDMFRTEKEIEVESTEREVKERHRSETKVEPKDGEAEAAESASSHKKHSHHHSKAKKKKEKKKKHKHKHHKHKHAHEHKKKVKEETLSSGSSAIYLSVANNLLRVI